MNEQEFLDLKTKAELGDIEAMQDLANRFYGSDGPYKDYSQAYYWFKKSAEGGNAIAMGNLGNWCYVCGNGVEKNVAEGILWLTKVADAGSVWSMNRLANIYVNEEGFKDLHKAFHYYKLAALQGDLNSIENLGGFCYLYGNGVEKNVEAAFDWLSLAINLGADDEWTKERFQKAFDIIGSINRNKSIEYLNTTLSSPQSLSEKSLFGQVYIVSDLAVELFNKERKRHEEEKERKRREEEERKRREEEELKRQAEEERKRREEEEERKRREELDNFKKQLKDKSITEIIIPDSIEKIESKLFEKCSHILKITIPNSVKEIGEYAFWGCSGLTSVTVPKSVTTIGVGVFRNCDRLTTIVVESGNTKYDSRENSNAIIETATNTLIQGCKNTTIPSSVTTIGRSAFEGCRGLTAITIPYSIKEIGKGAFFNCSGLTSITIPNSVKEIGGYAFYNCSGLTSITISNSVTMIRECAFSGCNGLTSVTIPNSVKEIEKWAFSGCWSLTTIKIPAHLKGKTGETDKEDIYD